MNVESHHDTHMLSDLEAPSTSYSQGTPFPTVRIVDTDRNLVPEDHRTYRSGMSVASSDTNFTDITATTTTTTASTRAQDNIILHNTTKTDPARLSPHQQRPIDPDSEIRGYYEQEVPKVPDLAEEMEKWYAMTDRFVRILIVKVILCSNVGDS